MPLVETALTAIVQKAFNYALEQGQNKVVGWTQDKLGLESCSTPAMARIQRNCRSMPFQSTRQCGGVGQ